MENEGRKGSSLSAIRYIGSRTFYKRGKLWLDGTFNPMKHKSLTDVVIGSKEYFALLEQDSRIAKYLALGDVILPVKGKWYRIAAKKSGK